MVVLLVGNRQKGPFDDYHSYDDFAAFQIDSTRRPVIPARCASHQQDYYDHYYCAVDRPGTVRCPEPRDWGWLAASAVGVGRPWQRSIGRRPPGAGIVQTAGKMPVPVPLTEAKPGQAL